MKNITVSTAADLCSGRIIGDNRDNSHDGRYFGPVMESKVNGRVIGRFWPIGSISSLMDNQ